MVSATGRRRRWIYRICVSVLVALSSSNRRAYVLSSLFLLLLLFFVFFPFSFEAFRGRNKRKTTMSFKIVDATLANFDEVFQRFRSEAPKNKVNLIVFLADKDPSTSLSWCPDCVRAEPVIYKKLEASSVDVALLRAFVGDRPTWRNPSHPWRIDSTFKLKGVPTLVRWENDAIAGRLEDHEAHLETKIDALINGK